MKSTSPEFQELSAMNPCSDGLAYAKSKPSMKMAWDECEEPAWLLWYARRKFLIEKETSVRIACFSAREVLPIFEERRPDDKRPRLAIEAAEAWLIDHSVNTRAAAASAAAASASAASAYAAYAASAASYAASAYDASASAYAADAAASASAASASASAYAADAAASASAASYAASASARKAMKIKICTYIREQINPFTK
jgi:hypothetical protein